MNFLAVFCLYFLVGIHADELDYSIPRGVQYSRGPLYKRSPDNLFQCLDGSKSILYDQVNDDYCDCADGSDEPGTSACPNGKFFCANKGHTAEYIPSSRINDGICDCCDGSDEYSGQVKCSNICDELGKSAREERERLAIVARKGFGIRQQLAKQGQQLKTEKLDAVVPLRGERDALQPQLDAADKMKKDAEEEEKRLKDQHTQKWNEAKEQKKKEKAAELFKEIDTDGDQKITLAELQVLPYLDTDHDGVVSETEARVYLVSSENGDSFDQFLESSYDLLKAAIRSHEDAKQDQRDDLNADEDKEVDTDGEGPESDTEHHDDDEEVEPPLDADTQNAVDEELEELLEMEKGLDDELLEELEDSEPPFDPDTQKAVNAATAARTAHSEILIKFNSLDSKIREADDFAKQDFGPDFAWASLKGQCFELSEMQYIYKICPFDKTIQKDKNGHGETSLGYFKEWVGPAPRKYSAQRFAEGQQCWNGPQRSTHVTIECGEEHQLMSASEPAKCEYHFVFRTPCACNDPDQPEPVHTEL